MLHNLVLKSLLCFKCMSYERLIYRHLRNVPCRGGGPTLLKGRVKTVTDYPMGNFTEAKDFDEFKSKMKRMFVEEDELKIEEELINENNYSSVFTNSSQLYDMNVIDEKLLNRKVRKHDIKRKYFKIEKESNLLTYAAKKQIRYLHQVDPLEWTPEKLSESFPISVAGVKKLLKNNFEQTCAEKIREHDKKVAERWEILNFGKYSDEIMPTTYKLWKEGKLEQKNYTGNSLLPSVPEPQPDIKPENIERKEIGEHLAIVQKYLDYKKQLQLKDKKDISTSHDSSNQLHFDDKYTAVKKDIMPKLRLKYLTNEDIEDQKSETFLASEKPEEWDTDIPFNQFKSNFKDELEIRKDKSTVKKEFRSWMDKEEALSKMQTEKKPYNASKFFTKIQKYEKKSMEINKDYDSDNKPTAYYYDEHLGYQYPVGKTLNSHIKIPSHKYRKGSTYQYKQCVYDDDGKLLYRLPKSS